MGFISGKQMWLNIKKYNNITHSIIKPKEKISYDNLQLYNQYLTFFNLRKCYKIFKYKN